MSMRRQRQPIRDKVVISMNGQAVASIVEVTKSLIRSSSLLLLVLIHLTDTDEAC